MIQLPAAVVGHIDDVHPVLDGNRRILGGGNSFYDEGDLKAILKALYVVPVELGLADLATMGIQTPGGRDITFCQIALATGVHRQVHGKTESVKSRGNRPLRMVLDPSLTFTHIQLIDLRARCRGGNLLQPRLTHRAMHTDDAKFTRGSRRGSRSTWIQVLQSADWREHDRYSEVET